MFEKFKDRIVVAGHSNEKVKVFQDMINGKEKSNDTFVVEGVWCLDYLVKSKVKIISILYCEEYLNNKNTCEVLEQLFEREIEIISVSKKVFDKISTFDGPDGVMVIASFPSWNLEKLLKKGNNQIVILDGLETSGNIGTIIRAAEGFGVDAIFITNKRAKINSIKTIKSAMGGCFFVPIIEWNDMEECKKWLQEHKFVTYLTDTRATKRYYQANYQGNVAFVAGNERYGINRGWYSQDALLISIPMLGNCDSLNVSVSTTIVMCEISMQQHCNINNR